MIRHILITRHSSGLQQKENDMQQRVTSLKNDLGQMHKYHKPLYVGCSLNRLSNPVP